MGYSTGVFNVSELSLEPLNYSINYLIQRKQQEVEFLSRFDELI